MVSVSDDALDRSTHDGPAPLEGTAGAGVVVGVDGSSGSMKALRWALERSDRFGPVQIVAAWHYPWWGYAMPISPPADQFRQLAVHAAEDAVFLVNDGQLPPPIICRADAGPTLVDIGAGKDLIVVGTRGRSGLKDSVLGSVSSYVVANATVPIAVVPASASIDEPKQRVVVGIDGSVNALRALSWALKHTSPELTIEAVHCWIYPVDAMPELAVIPRGVYEDQARFVLDEAVDAVTRAVGSRGHRIERRLEYGDARSALQHRSEAADLLVLGARGRGGLSHLLLGSVTTSLVHCPSAVTVVVPSRGQQPDH